MFDSFVPLGIIGPPHGVRGEVKVISYTDPAEKLFSYPLTDADGKAILLTKTGIQPTCFIARIAGVEDRNAAATLKQHEIGVDRSLLPPVEAGTLLMSDIVGCAVYDTEKFPIGTVRSVANFGASDILIIDTMDGELMLPFSNRFFPEHDVKSRVLICDMPEVVTPQSMENPSV